MQESEVLTWLEYRTRIGQEISMDEWREAMLKVL